MKLRKQHSLRSSGTSSIFVVDQLEPYFQLNLSTKSPLLSKPHCNNGFSCFVSETKELVASVKQNLAAKNLMRLTADRHSPSHFNTIIFRVSGIMSQHVPIPKSE